MSFNYVIQSLCIFPFILLVYRQVSAFSLKWYEYLIIVSVFVLTDFSWFYFIFLEFAVLILFLLFVKPFKAFDEYYFEFSSQNKEIVLFWTKV